MAVAMQTVVSLAYLPLSEYDLCRMVSQAAKDEAEKMLHV